MDFSKKRIDKLGAKISKSSGNLLKDDLEELQEYRKTFKEPLSKVFDALKRLSLKVDGGSIVTYRIKRIDTIIEKLRRFSDGQNGRMSLSTMGDIAGCRCILHTEKQVYLLKDLLIKEFGDFISGVDKYDYIKSPKKDGYRSLHLHVKDVNSDRKVEIQLRTIEQHNWATLVEIVDLIYGTKIKEGKIDNKDLKYFLYLFSKKNDLLKKEIKDLISIEQKSRIYEKMCNVFSKNFLKIRQQWMLQEKLQGSYYVIEVDKEKNSIINRYNNYEEAENAYYTRYKLNKDSNIVLTHIRNAKFEQISRAYANYILSVHTFFEDYKLFIEGNVIETLYNGNIIKLWCDLNLYRKITLLYIRALTEELVAFSKFQNNKSLNKKSLRNWNKDCYKTIQKWNDSANVFINKQIKSIRGRKSCFPIIMIQYFLLQRQIKSQVSRQLKEYN